LAWRIEVAGRYDEGMDDRRSPIVPPLIAAFFAAMIAGYVVAYFQLGTVNTLGPGIVRTYPGQVLANFFTPPAIVESWIRRQPVYVGHT